MSYNVLATSFFERELKTLAKKHRSLKKDLEALITKLEENPTTGTELGNHCYKIRLAITS
jgi:mRNA-degrading endonuclease RelE of RelBE toxin-antitoxin system